MFRTVDIQNHGVAWGLDYFDRNLHDDMRNMTARDLVATASTPLFYQMLAFAYEVRRGCDLHQRTHGPSDLTFNANLKARNAVQILKSAQLRLVRPSIYDDLEILHSRIEAAKIGVTEGLFRMHELAAGRTIECLVDI